MENNLDYTDDKIVNNIREFYEKIQLLDGSSSKQTPINKFNFFKEVLYNMDISNTCKSFYYMEKNKIPYPLYGIYTKFKVFLFKNNYISELSFNPSKKYNPVYVNYEFNIPNNVMPIFISFILSIYNIKNSNDCINTFFKNTEKYIDLYLKRTDKSYVLPQIKHNQYNYYINLTNIIFGKDYFIIMQNMQNRYAKFDSSVLYLETATNTLTKHYVLLSYNDIEVNNIFIQLLKNFEYDLEHNFTNKTDFHKIQNFDLKIEKKYIATKINKIKNIINNILSEINKNFDDNKCTQNNPLIVNNSIDFTECIKEQHIYLEKNITQLCNDFTEFYNNLVVSHPDIMKYVTDRYLFYNYDNTPKKIKLIINILTITKNELDKSLNEITNIVKKANKGNLSNRSADITEKIKNYSIESSLSTNTYTELVKLPMKYPSFQIISNKLDKLSFHNNNIISRLTEQHFLTPKDCFITKYKIN